MDKDELKWSVLGHYALNKIRDLRMVSVTRAGYRIAIYISNTGLEGLILVSNQSSLYQKKYR